MATYNVTLPNGVVLKGIPEGMTKEELVKKLERNGMDTSWYKPERPAVPTGEVFRQPNSLYNDLGITTPETNKEAIARTLKNENLTKAIMTPMTPELKELQEPQPKYPGYLTGESGYTHSSLTAAQEMKKKILEEKLLNQMKEKVNANTDATTLPKMVVSAVKGTVDIPADLADLGSLVNPWDDTSEFAKKYRAATDYVIPVDEDNAFNKLGYMVGTPLPSVSLPAKVASAIPANSTLGKLTDEQLLTAITKNDKGTPFKGGESYEVINSNHTKLNDEYKRRFGKADFDARMGKGGKEEALEYYQRLAKAEEDAVTGFISRPNTDQKLKEAFKNLEQKTDAPDMPFNKKDSYNYSSLGSTAAGKGNKEQVAQTLKFLEVDSEISKMLQRAENTYKRMTDDYSPFYLDEIGSQKINLKGKDTGLTVDEYLAIKRSITEVKDLGEAGGRVGPAYLLEKLGPTKAKKAQELFGITPTKSESATSYLSNIVGDGRLEALGLREGGIALKRKNAAVASMSQRAKEFLKSKEYEDFVKAKPKEAKELKTKLNAVTDAFGSKIETPYQSIKEFKELVNSESFSILPYGGTVKPELIELEFMADTLNDLTKKGYAAEKNATVLDKFGPWVALMTIGAAGSPLAAAGAAMARLGVSRKLTNNNVKAIQKLDEAMQRASVLKGKEEIDSYIQALQEVKKGGPFQNDLIDDAITRANIIKQNDKPLNVQKEGSLLLIRILNELEKEGGSNK